MEKKSDIENLNALLNNNISINNLEIDKKNNNNNTKSIKNRQSKLDNSL